MRGGRAPGAEVSMLKIRGTEIQQTITELMMQAAGPLAQPFRPVGEAPDFDTVTAGLAPRYCQLPQDLDLRRIQRDPAQHHRQDEPGPVEP